MTTPALPPLVEPDIRAALAEVATLYEEADGFVREVAEFRDEVVIPANNELRYTGHHILQSVGEDGTIVRGDQIRKAKSHCERAMYDASEAGMMAAVSRIVSFRDNYPGIVIKDIISSYPEIRLLAQQAQEQIIAGRTNRESVQAQTRSYMATFRRLRDAVGVLEAGRDDLNVQLAINQKADRRFILNLVTTIAVGLVGAAVALVAAIWF